MINGFWGEFYTSFRPKGGIYIEKYFILYRFLSPLRSVRNDSTYQPSFRPKGGIYMEKYFYWTDFSLRCAPPDASGRNDILINGKRYFLRIYIPVKILQFPFFSFPAIAVLLSECIRRQPQF